MGNIKKKKSFVFFLTAQSKILNLHTMSANDNNSAPSTACSSPSNDSVEKIFKNDSVRYRRKGYGLISAILITFSFFYFVPIIFKPGLEYLKEHFTDGQIYILIGWGGHFGIFTFSNVVMYFIYKAKSPF